MNYALLVVGLSAFAGDDTTWQSTLDEVVPAVVSIRVTGTRDFGTEDARTGLGTGFVIDAENGWILTNRHMVHAGPVVAEAILEDSEEIDLRAIYRDPVHDFGFYQFDPADIKHMELAELALAPQAAQVGLDIRVVGNDAGEKISILDGTLARVDRNAPKYGRTTYNDFNTFYLQAASNTSGGSSGSPVVNIDGEVVALNAGGSNRAASSFYLPLDRVVRAFEYVRRGEDVPRGTLQTTFRHTTFGELERLGLPESEEDALRDAFDGIVGGLTVSKIVPGGPADGELLPGDIVLSVDGDRVVDFVGLETRLDDAVGQLVRFRVQRGNRALDVDLRVQDLHKITPDEYLEMGRAVFTPVSYQSARNFDIPVAGVYVSVGGYALSTAGVPEGSVIFEIEGKPTPDLDSLQRVLESKANRERVNIRFFTIDDARHPYEATVTVDRRWFEMRRCKRDDSTGRWPCTVSPPPPPETLHDRPKSLVLPVVEKPARAVAPALVRVDFDVPHPTAGVKDLNYVGIGTIVDKKRGLILVDRDTVPVRLGDLTLTFAGAVRVPGEVVYLDPIHNFGVVRYNPESIGEVPVTEIELSERVLKEGENVWLVGLDRRQSFVNKRTKIESFETLELGVANTPRFRDANIEVYDIKDSEATLGGVLTDKKGRVVATWASFVDQGDETRRFHGLPTLYMKKVVDALRAGEQPTKWIFGADLEQITLGAARDRGLSDRRINALLKRDSDTRTLFEVSRINGLAPANDTLQNTDILLELNGELFTSISQVEEIGAHVSVVVLRRGREVPLSFDSLQVSGDAVREVVSWAGMIVHEPHFEVAAQKSFRPTGVYVAWLWYGSPAARYTLRPTRRILEINGTPTEDLAAFLSVVGTLEDKEAVRITAESLNGTRTVETMKMDFEYWPTQVFEVIDGVWQRRTLTQDPK